MSYVALICGAHTWRSVALIHGAHKLLALLITVVYILKQSLDDYLFIPRWMETVLTCSILSLEASTAV